MSTTRIRTWNHKVESVIVTEDIRLLWDFPIQTDQRIEHNRPDIAFENEKDRSRLLIDITCPFDTVSTPFWLLYFPFHSLRVLICFIYVVAIIFHKHAAPSHHANECHKDQFWLLHFSISILVTCLIQPQ